jgi:hypothetical protein
MSFKRLMLIISVVVGTVFAGSASTANTLPQDRVESKSELNTELTRARAPAMEEDFPAPMHGGDPTMEVEHFAPASSTPVIAEDFAVPMHGGDPTMEEHFDPPSFTPAMEEDFAVPMHGGDPTMEEHFDPASFTPVGGEDYRSRSSTNTMTLHGDYNLWFLEKIVEDWHKRIECVENHVVSDLSHATERRECRAEFNQ